MMAALVAFVVGIGAFQLQGELPSIAMLSAVGLAGVMAAVACVIARARKRLLATAAAATCAGFALGFAYAGALAIDRLADELAPADEGRSAVVTGVVATLPIRFERGVRFEFDVEQVDGRIRVPSRLVLALYAATEPVRPGERWRLTVRLRRPHGLVNPAGFDVEAWLLERNVRATGYVRTGRDDQPPLRLQSMVWRPLYAVERARAWLRDRLLAHLSDQRFGGVLLALVIGDQRAISGSDWLLFNRTGIAHLVSISGLHITMIAALVGGLVGAVWRRSPRLLAKVPVQTAAVLSGAVAALFYALLAGWGIPAQRTVLMLGCVGLAWIRRSALTPGRALVVAAALVCLVDPWSVISAGFWLSFGAVAAIIWVVQGRSINEAPHWRVALKTGGRVQLAVTLALIPATVFVFQQVSLISPLANAVAIPVVSWVTTPLALVGALFAMLPPPLDSAATALLYLANASFALLHSVLDSIATWPAAAISVPPPPIALVVVAAFGVAWVLAPPGWPLRATGAIALLPLFLWPVERPREGEVWVTALDVGQGASIVVETRWRAWLYDAGPRYSLDSDAGLRVVVPYLRWRGIDSLDGFVVSHLDSDHSGGAASVIATVPVDRVLTSIPPGHAALGGRTEVEPCAAGQEIQRGEYSLRVVHPLADDYTRHRPTNSMSCVVVVRAGATGLLLTGDVTAADEQAIAQRERSLESMWIAVPHHGSRTSSSDALLDAARPRWAAIQAGYRNRFGHPDAAVVERYQNRTVQVERTDRSGALQWRFGADGTVRLIRWRTEAVRYWYDRPRSGPASGEDPDPARASDDAAPLEQVPLEWIVGS